MTGPDTPLELHTLAGGAPRAYRVAGARLVTDVAYPALATYATGEPAAWASGAVPPPEPDAAVTFDGFGLLGDGYRRVVCRAGRAGFALWAEGLATYHIGAAGRAFETTAEPGVAHEARAAALLGAPLVLALALRGVFCLHAGVAEHGGELVAFIGESGAGKSTLARFLDGQGPAWRRIIDDTLPIAPGSEPGVVALPHFPQLKLPDEMQPARLVPEQMPLRAVYVVEATAAASEAAVIPLSRAEAALALVQHTVGGRLFGRRLLAEHLAACSDLAGRLPVRRLVYPRSFAALPAVRERLELEG